MAVADTAIRTKITQEVNNAFYNSKKCSAIRTKIRDGTATTSDMYELADEVGEMLSKSFKANLGEVFMEERELERLVVNSIVGGPLSSASELVGKEYMIFQDSFNQRMRTHLKALQAQPNQDKIAGICKRVAQDPASMEWMSEAPVKNLTRSVVTEQIKNNAEFLNKAGFEVTITRKLGAGGCCEWCKQLEGTYTMPDVPSEVFMAHDRCDCIVEVSDVNGKYLMGRSGHGFTRY